MSTLDWTIVAGYCLLTIGLGLWLSRRAGRSTEDYFLSGRTLPWWLAGTSMVATSFASDTPLVVAAWTRDDGIWKNWQWWIFGISTALATFFFARLWRRSKVATEVAFCELRYGGRGAGMLREFKALYFGVLINCWVLGTAPMLGLGKIMQVTTGIEPGVAIAICAGIAAIYCVASGFWGVVATDFVQFIVAMIGAVVLAVIVVGKVDGGLATVAAQVPEEKLAFAPWEGIALPFLISMLALQWWAFVNADGGGKYVQRVAACKSEGHAVGASLWYMIAHYALRSWPWIIVGLCSLILVPTLSDPDRIAMVNADSEMAYPVMVMAYLPTGMVGLMVASFLAAFMSTADTHMNWGASYLVNDLYRRFYVKNATERHYVTVARIASMLILGISALIAWQAESIGEAFIALLGFTAGLGPVLLARWFWWRTNAWSEVTAIVASGTLFVSWPLVRGWFGLEPEGGEALAQHHDLVKLTFITFGSMACWIAVTLVTPAESRERLVMFFRQIRPPGFWGPIAREVGPDVQQESFLQMAALWILGVIATFSLMLGIGKVLFGAWLSGGLLAGAAAISGAMIWKLTRTSIRRPSTGPQSA